MDNERLLQAINSLNFLFKPDRYPSLKEDWDIVAGAAIYFAFSATDITKRRKGGVVKKSTYTSLDFELDHQT